MMTATKNWYKLPREIVESPSLEIFKSHVDMDGGLILAGCQLPAKMLCHTSSSTEPKLKEYHRIPESQIGRAWK